MATVRLAEWAVSLQYADLPPAVVDAAVRSLYNWMGCALGGSHHPTTVTALRALQSLFGRPTSTLVGHQHAVGSEGLVSRSDAAHAALINGIASHVHDYDDTHLETIIHPTGPVASALLAQAEAMDRVCSGNEVVLALVTGIEAECKVGLAVWPQHYDVGWHITSTAGSIGAAVAVGKLLQLTLTQTAHAIGVAATQVTGLREMFGSDTKSFHVGRAAQNGLVAALLAAHGYTSSIQALEAKRGWGNVVSDGHRLDQQMASLGTVWEIGKNAFKPFPCGIVVHPVIDACIQLHDDMTGAELDRADIQRVSATVHPLVLELTGKKSPVDGLQAKFSVFHGAAVALVYGKAGPAQYEEAVVRSSDVVSVRDKIDAVADEQLAADEADVDIHFCSGRRLTKHVAHSIGSLEVPMTNEQLEHKFLDQVSLVLGAPEAATVSRLCWQLKDAVDIGQVLKQL